MLMKLPGGHAVVPVLRMRWSPVAPGYLSNGAASVPSSQEQPST